MFLPLNLVAAFMLAEIWQRTTVQIVPTMLDCAATLLFLIVLMTCCTASIVEEWMLKILKLIKQLAPFGI